MVRRQKQFRFPDGKMGPLRIAVIYAALSGLWILFSDRILASLVTESRLLTTLQTWKGLFFVVTTACLLAWLIRRYVRALRHLDKTLLDVVSGVSAAVGDAFFNSLAEHLSKALGGDLTVVGEIPADGRGCLHTIAVYGDGRLLENYTQPLAGTPYATAVAVGPDICIHSSGAARLYPDDQRLAAMGCESFIGTPLLDSSGNVLGIMAAMGQRPLDGRELAESIFRLFAVRAAAELERRKAEKSLREAEVTYRIVAENTHDWEFWVSPEGEFIYTSPSCVRVTGYTAAEFATDSELLLRIIHPEDLPFFLEHRQMVRDEVSAGQLEFRIIRPDGEVRWIGHVCQPVFDGGGRFLGNRGSNRDITGRKRAEEALREQFSQLSTIFDSLNAVVYVADLEDYRLLYINSYGASLFGGKWQGKKCHELLQADQVSPCGFCTNDRLVRDGEPQPPYIWEFRNTLTGRWFQCIDRAMRWTDGRLVRIEIAVDITERKEIERIREEMVSALSHEMRTPLTAMIGFTELLLEQEVDGEARREYLGIIHKESERLNELINTFLQLQRHRSQSELARFIPLPVRQQLEKAVAVYTGISPGHRLVIDCPTDLLEMRGDEEQVHQLLCNLLSNAIKYSPDGGVITVGAMLDGRSVVLSVRDEGIGIPADLQELIFDKFYRVDNTDSRRIGGTGLGLALVREIVALHSGRIWVESEPGKGSTFFVALPCWEEEAAS